MTARLRVVLVDDADELRHVVGMQLRLDGRFEVVAEGASGQDAVDLASEHRPDVLLLDASMPEVDGLEAIPAVRAAAPSTRIVMLSGFEEQGLRARALELGAVGYLEKSLPIAQLPDAIAALVDGPAGSPAGPVSAEATDRAQEVLDEHLERFRTVFEQAAIGMATVTLSGTIVRANAALGDLLRTPHGELVGVGYDVVSAETDVAVLRAAIADAVKASGAAVTLEHRLPATAGGGWATTTFSAMTDSSGAPLYLFAQTADVTERHEALTALRASEERFRLMVESVQDYAIFMLDPDGLVSTWNLGAERLKGYTADDIIGRHFRAFYPADAQQRRHPEHELRLAVRNGRYEEEGWRVRKDGTRFWANVVITALFDRDGQHVGFAKVTRDMTERQAAELARERAATDLARTNARLDEAARRTEDFVAVTAHELQSPVAVMTGVADILREHWDRLGPEERAESLQRISSGGARIRRLLADLLTASKLQAGAFGLTLERTDLAAVVERALAEVDGSVASATRADVPPLPAMLDRARVTQIVTNLLNNAARYGRPPVLVTAARAGGTIELRVTDGGAGVPDEILPRLFERFGPADAGTRRGTGLGLYIVRELARAHGGDARYEDAPGGGATFVIVLPTGLPEEEGAPRRT